MVGSLVLIFGSIIPILYAFKNYNDYEIGYVLESFMRLLLFFLVSLGLGATVWWKIYHKGIQR